MRLVPFRSILESALADPAEKRLTGQVTDFDTLMKPSTLEKLEEKHQGVFAFLAFHPGADRDVADYLQSGSLPNDSGPRILVLFTVDENATWGEETQATNIPGIKLDSTEHPSYQIIRLLFENKPVPSLPGIVIFDSFAKQSSAFYLSLAGLSEDEVRSLLRKSFELAAYAWKSDALHFASALGVAFNKNRISYARSDNISFAEWLAKSWQLVWEHKGEIVTFLASVAKAS